MKKKNDITSSRAFIVAQLEKLSNIPESFCLETQAGGAGNYIRKPPIIGLSADDSPSGKQPFSDVVIGLDIGTNKIVAIAGRINKSQKVEVIGYSETGSNGILSGKILNITKTTAGIKLILEDLSRQIELKIDLVTVNISGSVKTLNQQGIYTTIGSETEIREEDIQKLSEQVSHLLLPPGEAIVVTQIQEFIVDDEEGIVDPVGMTGIRLGADFKIISSPTISVNDIHKCVENSGHKVHQVCPAPLACAESVLNETEKEEGVVLVDIGGSTTGIIIYKNKIMRHLEVIPIGGDSITQDIKYWTGLSFKQAELLKKELGTALAETINENDFISVTSFQEKEEMDLSRKNLAYVIQSRVEELLTFVMKIIKLSGYEDDLHCGIVLTGGTALSPGITELTKKMTGLRCYIGLPDLYLAPNQVLPPDMYQKLMSPLCATVLGLVKIGLDKKFSGDVK